MQDEPRPECIWKPASQPRWRGRPEIMIGALIGLSVSCLTAGFVAGRLSGSPSAINVAHKSELPSPTPAVSDQPFKKQSERDTALVSDKAAPTIDYFRRRLPRYRRALIADLALTDEQVDHLIANGERYRDHYARGALVYRLLDLRR